MRKSRKKLIGKRINSVLIAVMMVVFTMATPFYVNRVEAATHYAAGIDVSYYQGTIDWQAVKDDGVQFVMVRVGSHKKGIDPQFAANMQGANAVGLRTGVYYYSVARTVQEAQQDANLVLQAIAPYTVSFPVAIDYEDSSVKDLSPADQAAVVTAFCDVVACGGYYPMVYASRNWFLTRMGNIAYDKWISQYNTALDYPEPYTMWQSSSHGQVKGIGYRVDVNHLYKDLYSFIIQDGFTERGGKTYLYRNYRKQLGWVEYNGARYVCEPTDNGAVQTGWFTDSLGRHYLDPAQGGKLLTGLQVIEGEAYLLDGNGLPYSGWSGKWPELYYFAEDGKMVRDKTVHIGQTDCTFDKEGHLTAPEGFDPAAAQ
ncbi:MAG: hypothetical protein IKO80_06170 [Lachnospiraceae bacterium]|nr:hypothetical protein [Lachnospiraceae bacterium]